MRASTRAAAVVAAAALAASVLAACDGSKDDSKDAPTGTPTATITPTAQASLAADPVAAVATDDPSLDAAVSNPVEDSVYPDVGDPSVDALHYGLDLAWTPSTQTLDADATIIFRAPTDEDHVQLDLGSPLTPKTVTLDGKDATFEHTGKNLVVTGTFTKDTRYTLEIRYSGTPMSAPAPTTRADLSTLGWTTTPQGEVWTMQEPYGAYTWYPSNDQPADKAFYDITITTPSPWTGVANGEETDSTDHGGLTTTTWHLSQPAASYLVTIAIGDYKKTENTSPQGGFPVTYWVPNGQSKLTKPLEKAAGALDWVEAHLGPYPFDSLGIVLVDSTSGMETETMLTLGAHDFDVSMPVLVHEIVHQWYGDEVTPDDWRDVWMNEGMAMYLQFIYESEQQHITLDQRLAKVVPDEARLRAEDGPPGSYDPSRFAESNVYYGPALMWHALRQQIGDARFWKLVRDWPAQHSMTSQGRGTFVPWLVQHSGVPESFFDAWLYGATSPVIHLDASGAGTGSGKPKSKYPPGGSPGGLA